MMLHIPGVLTREQVASIRACMEGAPEWVDGRESVGPQGAQVKRNRQLKEGSPLAVELGQQVSAALMANPLFFSSVLPLRVLAPYFNAYGGGEHYGLHIDGAVRAQRGGLPPVRADVSTTVFLSDPEDYDGGELVVVDAYGTHEVKLPAGDAIVYPSGSLHQVLPVTRGERVASFLWTQSMVRDDAKRAMLFELDTNIQKLRAAHGENEATVGITGHYHNLLRMWVEM
ncbi:Fe2+-dependent dioxygenase [Massilia yuzhufengensis]|uniref:PKHD-type hydroxylase n=1 Tax=Massilia yuzhufengensis TaxID=1164594 RepID=A0A1I1NCW3_9BURK|nr:Fe2+-dependent dioxygenase [Massilia yuzhufengensis]SFC95196.1 PKHD-type hydroxylase [Massilia yuzhufengensis]